MLRLAALSFHLLQMSFATNGKYTDPIFIVFGSLFTTIANKYSP